MCRIRKIAITAVLALLTAVAAEQSLEAVLPEPVAAPAHTAPAEAEDRNTIAAMKPPKRARPVVAVLGDNRGTEAIDFLVPYGVLAESGAADVFAVAMTAGNLQLRPALAIKPHMDITGFDARFPDGADYVVVPAMTDHETPAVLEWIRTQAAKGATIVAVCAGAEIVANAGLLKGRVATTHWASVATMINSEPKAVWKPHRRYVADRGIVTTTGVSAAVPMSVALVEAIAGRDRAAVLAARLGLDGWARNHDSNAYRLGNGFYVGMRNKLSGWGAEELGIAVRDGVNEISLALSADAWSRTYRSQAVTVADANVVRTRNGLELIVDRRDRRGIVAMLPEASNTMPAKALDQAFDQMAARYGRETMKLVAVQLEHERGASGQ